MIPCFMKSKQGICNIDLPKGFPIHPQISQSVQEFQEMCQVAKQRAETDLSMLNFSLSE